MEYGNFSLEIGLNRMGYKSIEIDELFQEPFDSGYPTSISYAWHPSAVGWDMITISLVVGYTLKGVADGYLNQIGSDLAVWSKNTLSKLLKRKKDFSNSSISIVFNDKDFYILLENEEEIVEILSYVPELILYIKENEELIESEDTLVFDEIILKIKRER